MSRLLIILVSLGAFVADVAAQANRPTPAVIRFFSGASLEVPEGWDWIEFDGRHTLLEHVATRAKDAQGRESSPNRLEVSLRTIRDDALDRGWGTLDLDGQRSLPNGARARWKAGQRFDMHYAFDSETLLGSRIVKAARLGPTNPKFDPATMERALLRIAETLREVPESPNVYHPDLRFASARTVSTRWFVQAYKGGTRYGCFQKYCGDKSNTWILVYPSAVAFADAGTALANITTYFEKNASLKIGETRRVEIPGGEILWTEQPGSGRPFLGIAKRDGRYFFLNMSAVPSNTLPNDSVRDEFLSVAKGVRAWDGH